jgi:murein DD-endopeptidase MepM/ murein hydrolase activator NlpD
MEMEDALYRTLLPEEGPSSAGSPLNPAILRMLQLATHAMQSGETISQIAQEHKLNLDTVLSWNDIRDARVLKVGTVLAIPNADGLKYTVRRGDSLGKIARNAGVPLNGVLDWNGLTSELITPGQELFLPGARMSSNQLNGIMGKLFIFPVAGQVSSRFGSRPDPFTGEVRYHEGIDLAADIGTPVAAAMNGTVRSTGLNPIYGKFIILQHDGYQTLYGHLNRILVDQGQKVVQGARIGEVGNTGYSTGPHLHFGIYRGGAPVDPLRFLH